MPVEVLGIVEPELQPMLVAGLRKLCQATREGIRKSLSLIMEQTYERMLVTEQLSIGWEAQTKTWR